MADDDIIERRPSSPIATSCVIISTVALLGALILQIAEIGEIRDGVPQKYLARENPADAMYQDVKQGIVSRSAEIIATNTAGDADLPHADAIDRVEDVNPGSAGADDALDPEPLNDDEPDDEPDDQPEDEPEDSGGDDLPDDADDAPMDDENN